MKVGELREIIEKYDSDRLKKTLVEVYKKIPKNVKEDKAIDDIIRYAYTVSNKKRSKKIDPERVIAEANYFMELARNGLYFKPNRIVSKSDRGKWRTRAKYLINSLRDIPDSSEYYGKAGECFINMFKLFCDAQGSYYFVSVKPFEAMKISKGDMFEESLSRIFHEGYSEKSVERALDLLLYSIEEYSFSRISLLNIFLFRFKIQDTMELLLNELKKHRGDFIVYLKSRLYYKMGDSKNALRTIKRNIKRSDYDYYSMIFSVIALNNDVENWKKEYEEYKRKGNSNRNIDMINNELKETGEFISKINLLYF